MEMIFNFTKGDYTIKIFADSPRLAEIAWEQLQARNYYPTDKKWYVRTNSCKPV